MAQALDDCLFRRHLRRLHCSQDVLLAIQDSPLNLKHRVDLPRRQRGLRCLARAQPIVGSPMDLPVHFLELLWELRVAPSFGFRFGLVLAQVLLPFTVPGSVS